MPDNEGALPTGKKLSKGSEGTPAQTTATPVKARRRWWKHRDVNNGEKSFASGLNIYKIIWIFAIGCFIGVAWEVFYVLYKEGVYMRRSGMLYGPFNQIYGFGAVLLTLALYRFRHRNAFIIFLASAVIGTAFEFVCSWTQEMVLGSTSWDYSNMRFNIAGRVNLFYAVGWGIMGFLFIRHLYPFLSEMIERIPNTFGKTLTILFAVALAVDLALSGMAVYRAGVRAEDIPPSNAVGRWLDETYPDSVMHEKYPSMTFIGDKNSSPAYKPASGKPSGG